MKFVHLSFWSLLFFTNASASGVKDVEQGVNHSELKDEKVSVPFPMESSIIRGLESPSNTTGVEVIVVEETEDEEKETETISGEDSDTRRMAELDDTKGTIRGVRKSARNKRDLHYGHSYGIGKVGTYEYYGSYSKGKGKGSRGYYYGYSSGKGSKSSKSSKSYSSKGSIPYPSKGSTFPSKGSTFPSKGSTIPAKGASFNAKGSW